MHQLRDTVATVAALALTAGIAVGAAATDGSSDDELVGVYSIEGLTWLLTSQMVDGEMAEVPARLNISLRMENGDAGGNGGCNSYFTSYEMDGFDVSFGPIGSTMMVCLPPVMEVEQAYFANLGEVVAYQSGGIQMAFLNEAGDFILEFDLAPEATVVGSWVAQGINNQLGENAGVVTSAITSEVTADFGADGTLAGFDGCNDYFTSYEVDGGSISIAPEFAQTRKACPSDELAEQAAWFYGALTAATTWSVDAAGDLELRDDSGALQVRFSPTA